MVVVTDSSFLEWTPILRTALLNCDFIALDFEFLGLNTSTNTLYDSTEERYQKLLDNVIKYRPCQLGLTFFKQSTNGGYKADSYSFPLLQRFGPAETTISFPSLRFLRENKFDLNEVFSEGVEFCSREQFRKFEKSLKKGTVSSYLGADVQNEVEILKLAIHEKVHMDMEETEETEDNSAKRTPSLKKSFALKLEKTLCSVEMSIVLYELTKSFPHFSFKRDTDTIIVNNSSPLTSASENESAARRRCSEAFDGISGIMEAAMMMKKPLVCHNGLLDCMHMFHYFFGDLPEKYADFKEEFHHSFPTVFDSKYLAQTLRKELDGVADSLEKLGDFFGDEHSDRMVPSQLRGYIDVWMNPMDSEDETRYHNAAFDSYVTGEVFLKMAHIYVTKRNTLKSETVSFKQLLQYLDARIVNRLPFQLMDVGHCYLGGMDPAGNRPDIVNIVRRDGKPIGGAEFREQEAALKKLSASYQCSMQLSSDSMLIRLAPNTPGFYAFICDKYSNHETLTLLDELQSGEKWTFEQRQTAWRCHKKNEAGDYNPRRRQERQQIVRMEKAFAK